MRATGGLAAVHLPADATGSGRAVDTHTALLPLSMDGQRLPVRHNPPSLGEHSTALLRELGYRDGEIAALRAAKVVGDGVGAADMQAPPAHSGL